MMKTYALFAGPSGGHLFPAVAFAEVLRRREPEARIHLITSGRAHHFVSHMPPHLFNQVHYAGDFPLPSGFSFRSVSFVLELIRGFIFSSRCLSKIRPDCCVGFGSYVAYPGMILAVLRRIPTLIHEQNLVPGKATLWLVRHVDCVAVTFPETFAAEKLRKRMVTGLPLRSSLAAVARAAMAEPVSVGTKSGFGGGNAVEDDRPFRVLVVGGSQGAHRLNEVVLEAFSRFTPEEKRKIAVIHITGKTDHARVSEAYEKTGVACETYVFFENMQELYGRADMAITRAGANTLFELALFRLPAIVVPYPYAGSHQVANAEHFASRGAVISQAESALTVDWLFDQVSQLFHQTEVRNRLSHAISGIGHTEAADRLVDLTEKLMEPS